MAFDDTIGLDGLCPLFPEFGTFRILPGACLFAFRLYELVAVDSGQKAAQSVWIKRRVASCHQQCKDPRAEKSRAALERLPVCSPAYGYYLENKS